MTGTAVLPTAAAATAATAPTTTPTDTDTDTDAANNNNNNSTPQNKKKAKPHDYNPRWKGYVYISIASLVNFCSISNIPGEYERSYWVGTICFGVLTFALAILVLIQDRSQKCLKPFYYSMAKDGYFEGYTLCFTVVWWIAGYVTVLLCYCCR
jgi:hypothetical protein